ncbi:hypothetical protein CBL_00851 [Carabus blaptoides fortunei]
MANYIRAVQNFFTQYFQRENVEEDKASKIEAYLSVIYKLLIWEEPFLSGFALFIAHVLFWFVVHFELRLYGVLFLSFLVLFVLDASFDGVVTQVDKSVVPLRSIRETIKLFTGFLHYLSNLRREHPGTFCVCMCTGFLVLSIIGRTLSGLVLSYFGLLSLLLIPGVIHRLPPEILDTVRHTLRIISNDEGVVDENELFPTGQDGLLEEKDADFDSLKTDHTADSYTNSFISGVTSMPSYLEAEGSLDGLEEEDLEFTTRNIPAATPSNYSTDTSDSEHKDIKFEASHFNRDSSTDEEHNYEQGLTFPELDMTDKQTDKSTTAVSFTQQLSADILSNLGTMGSSIVSTVLKTAAATAPPAARVTKRNDSDSDFEIIDSEDIQNDET